MTQQLSAQVMALLQDYALDPLGQPDGLTIHEFARAWRARHHTAAPFKTLYRMSERLVVQMLPKRQCCISNRRTVAWVPRRMDQ